MNLEESTPNDASSEFILELSGFLLFMKRFLQVGAVWVLAVGVFDSFNLRTPWPLVASLLNAGICFVLATFAIRTFPRKITLEGDSVVFHKVPTAWIDIGPMLLPLGITQRLVRPKSAVVLEWIGRSLTLNDMDEGKSVRLAAGKHADKLALWFSSIGVAGPVGG
jgi:hypothetical protein